MADAHGGGRVTPSRWTWLLVASLALNLLVVGLFAGALVPAVHDDKPREKVGLLLRFAETLPAARALELKKIIEAHKPEKDSAWREVRDARLKIVDIAAEEPLDKDALQAALARYREADASFKVERTRTFFETILQMTPEERRGFRDWRRKWEVRREKRRSD